MANRFWVGGTGTWDGTSTTHWSATSGGSSGASVPTGADDVTFDGNSNATAYTVTIGTTAANCGALTMSNPGTSGVVTMTLSSVNLNPNGNVQLAPSMTFNGGGLKISPRGVNLTFNANGTDLSTVFFENGSGITVTLLSDITVQRYQQNDSGLITGNFNITVLSLGFGFGGTTGTVTAGTSIIEIRGTGTVFNNTLTAANLTWTGGTIKITDATASGKTFAGNGATFGNLWYAPGAGTGALTITGSNTFTDFKDDGTAAHSILFTSGTTTTVTTFTVTGNGVGNEISINTAGGLTTTHSLVAAGSAISCDYLNIQHSVATPANTWYAGTHSINNQGVATIGSGWIFTGPPGFSGSTSDNVNVSENVQIAFALYVDLTQLTPGGPQISLK